MFSWLTKSPFFASLALAIGCGGEVVAAAAGAGGATGNGVPDGGLEASSSNCDGGEELPAALVGSFMLHDVGCGPAHSISHDFWTQVGVLHTTACGYCYTGVPDGYLSNGAIHRAGDGYRYVAVNADVEFQLRALEIERGGAPVLLLETVEVGAAPSVWAIRRPDLTQTADAGVALACGAHESWTLHELYGSAAGKPIATGEGPVAADTRLELGNVQKPWIGDASVELTDLHLAFSTGGDNYFGTLFEWDGTSGRVVHQSGEAACMELDGDLELERQGDAWIVYADWLVLDVTDVDYDGDSQELMVRRTRLVTSPSTCP